MPEKPSANLRAIATMADVSPMTVSRVLRNSPRVTTETRERVLAATAKLDYQPDPHLSRMMHLVRGRKAKAERGVIALIREHVPRDVLHDPAYQYVDFTDIERRAAQHGYRAEEFWLGRNNLTARRLTSILQARGIEGIIVSPQSSKLLCAGIDYSCFASVAIARGLPDPPLHRAMADMMLGIQTATVELTRRGYRRIGLAITRWIDDRSHNFYSGAMLHFQQSLPPRQRVPLLLFPHNDIASCRDIFTAWMKKHRPDALISFDTHVPGWLKQLRLRFPEDIGFVAHDWNPKSHGLAGISHRRDQTAAAAVDLLATQLLHNERGIPAVPRQIMITPEWVEGASVRKIVHFGAK
ncbi:MAG: LacI family transcriptional regulator [Verrucomicrobiaceae bacterium]|nr:LacI family transcriptional regulator [Verrucomicrobiaceae bacterium]